MTVAGRLILGTERLRLRELTRDDVPFIAALIGDPEVMTYFGSAYDADHAARWVDRQLGRYARDGYGYWLAEEATTGEAVGQVGLMELEVEGTNHPGLGYMLGRSSWGRGFATEAARGVLDLALGPLGKNRVITLIRPENEPSLRVAARLGLRPLRLVSFYGFPHQLFEYTRADRDAKAS